MHRGYFQEYSESISKSASLNHLIAPQCKSRKNPYALKQICIFLMLISTSSWKNTGRGISQNLCAF